ncbi:GMC family oxidoreductase N-terminal domain-containing protein [Dechloromonas sp. ARDL1]|uniref:GMC family oxidoreductase N-terminal domain-containing protein n=1 Tax=Dechloromonas sp. ARDL1 TaxID=3322121 RepID=UPI003DA76254
MMNDPFREGLAAGWRHIDASTLDGPLDVEADVVIVGSGAGGGVTAEILTNTGLKVIIVEEGPLRTSSDFHMRESDAYPALYQESAARKTADKAINILQGRCVGGSTTVNWTSSFRTPPATLHWWQTAHGLRSLTVEALAPWFYAMEMRLHIGTWPVAPNANNSLLAAGAAKLGIPTHPMRRNVKRCWDLGYCGMGCPTNAKQSMLLTTLPVALSKGATLYSRLRAERLVFAGRRVDYLEAQALAADGLHPGAARIKLRARHVVLAGGAINSPALLLRSKAPDPAGLTGTRTFLHPTVISSALFDAPVRAHAGAPQSVYSDHFLDDLPIDGPLGYKLEVPPLHPVLFATTLQGWGESHRRLMEQFDRCQTVLALLRDGFHPDSRGGRVRLRDDGSPLLDYPLNDPIWDGVRRALITMAEIQFAAGARWVTPVHETAPGWSNWRDAKAGLAALPLAPLVCRMVSAHVMGGCAMADSPERGLTDDSGRHFHVDNLSIHDGSVFPTSIGANPQLSIYGLVARNASLLAASLTGRPKPAIL